MPDLKLYKKLLGGTSAGEQRKIQSDMIMEYTWDNDLQSKKCYIYDFYHDSEPDKSIGQKPYEDPLKTEVSVKFIVTQYGTLAKDQVEYHIQFKPSHTCNLDYFEQYTSRYQSEYPIGLYIDIPDSQNIYRKWLICSRDYEPQFVKYSILPCNYLFHWVEDNGKNRYLRSMWGIARLRSSYNSGVWRDYIIQTVENQDQIWLPINDISIQIPYGQRFIVSTLKDEPLTWEVSKLENVHPFGINKITIKQTKFDSKSDFINWTTGEMYADYYKNTSLPIDKNDNEEPECSIVCSGTTNVLKVGGGYKTLTAIFNEIPDNLIWSFFIDNDDALPYLIFLDTNNPCVKKIKLVDDDSLLNKILKVEVSNGKCTTSLSLDIVAL